MNAVVKRDLDTIVECITCEDGGEGYAKLRAFIDEASEEGMVMPFIHQFSALCRMALGQAKFEMSETYEAAKRPESLPEG